MAFGSMNSGDDAPMADINVTPLVDVMLVLLIVFMITMPVMTHSIPLSLPTASESAGKVNAPKDPIYITIAADGSYYIGSDSGNKIELSALMEYLKVEQAKDENRVVAISADESVPYNFVNQMLGAARDVGISKIGFVTETKSE